MLNQVKEIKKEIKNWLEIHNYTFEHLSIINSVFIHVSSKISKKDINEFNEKFNTQLKIISVEYDEFENITQIEYECNPDQLNTFKIYLNNWLTKHRFPSNHTLLMEKIYIECFERLSDNQIKEFEEEFNVKFRKYEIKCNRNYIEYTFS